MVMLLGLGTRAVAVRPGTVALSLARPVAAAAVAAAAGRLATDLLPGPVTGLAAGCLVVPLTFLLTGLTLRAPEAVHLLALIRQRFPHGR
ncbi:hypothetical protein [[Kitasatospora] papulosa]|uniref:hypothetical protein n=1 Tax=[Kitasatospora] papulosa TaxID=1464011 RepID=UPI0036B813DB